MLFSLKLTPSNILTSQIHKREDFDKITVPIAKIQYCLRFYLLYLFDCYLAKGSHENLQALKQCVSLIRHYSSLHKEFMMKKSTDTTGILEEISSFKPHLILQEGEWK